MSRFILKGLAEAQFADLFTLDDQQLAARQMRRLVADSPNGYPCRISLDDAEPGDEVLALPYQHQGGDSPYRASGPIFVRQGARQAELAPLLEDFFADPALAYVQLHTASRGCYLCQAERAQP